MNDYEDEISVYDRNEPEWDYISDTNEPNSFETDNLDLSFQEDNYANDDERNNDNDYH